MRLVDFVCSFTALISMIFPCMIFLYLLFDILYLYQPNYTLLLLDLYSAPRYISGTTGGLADTRGAVAGTSISVFPLLIFTHSASRFPLLIFTHSASRFPFKRPRVVLDVSGFFV